MNTQTQPKKMLIARLTICGLTPERKNNTLTNKVNNELQSSGHNVAYTCIFDKDITKEWCKETSTLRTAFDKYSISSTANTGWRCFTGSGLTKYRELHNDRVAKLGDVKSRMKDAYEINYKKHLRELGDTPGVIKLMEPDTFVSKFSVNLRLSTCPRPEDFDEILAVDKAEIEHQYKSDIESFRKNMFEEMTDLVKHVTTAYSEEKVKNARTSPLTNLQEYLSFAKDKNVLNDPMFDKFADSLMTLVNGITVDDIKESDNVRNSLTTGANIMLTSIGKQIPATPKNDEELFAMFA
jgi:hypothetical protein